MAAVTRSHILSAWRALAGGNEAGWRSIDFFETSTCRVKLARRLPNDEEAILIGFKNHRPPNILKLPKGQGFRMERAELGEVGGNYNWLALIKQSAGGVELFASVVADIARLLSGAESLSESQLCQHLLGRVRGWQEFMRKGRDGLAEEAEQGLFAELYVLQHLLDSGMPLKSAVDAWKGPFDGLHDFVLPGGAVEIKSTIASGGFLVKIGSLDQLNDHNVAALYLVGVRLTIRPEGKTLVEMIEIIRRTVKPDTSAFRVLESALLDVGFLDTHADSYTKKFDASEKSIYKVDSIFPRLVPHNVSSAIQRAQYELDLTQVAPRDLELMDLLKFLGVE